MKRKEVKKLTLNPETIRNLDERHLEHALGAGPLTKYTAFCSLCITC